MSVVDSRRCVLPFADHETTRAVGEHQQDGPDHQEQHRTTTMRPRGPWQFDRCGRPLVPLLPWRRKPCGIHDVLTSTAGSAHGPSNAEDYPHDGSTTDPDSQDCSYVAAEFRIDVRLGRRAAERQACRVTGPFATLARYLASPSGIQEGTPVVKATHSPAHGQPHKAVVGKFHGSGPFSGVAAYCEAGSPSSEGRPNRIVLVTPATN